MKKQDYAGLKHRPRSSSWAHADNIISDLWDDLKALRATLAAAPPVILARTPNEQALLTALRRYCTLTIKRAGDVAQAENALLDALRNLIADTRTKETR